jgi:hypothetical protein
MTEGDLQLYSNYLQAVSQQVRDQTRQGPCGLCVVACKPILIRLGFR